MGLLYSLPFTITTKYGTLKQTANVHLRAKFRVDQFILSPLRGKNLKLYHIFNYYHKDLS